MSCLCIRVDNIISCVQVIIEMRISQNIKPPCNLDQSEFTLGNLLKVPINLCVSMIRLVKVSIIEISSNTFRHLYLFSSSNIRIVELEDEII